MGTFKLFHRILFNIEFELNGYRDDVAQYIQVQPDEATHELFSKYRIIFRRYRNSYLALIEVGSDVTDLEQLKIEIPQNEVFRFEVKIRDIVFFSRTHLYAYDFRTNVLMLSNEVNHIEGSDILLTKAISNYASAGDYQVGYLVRDGANYFSAVQPSNAADAHPVTDAAYWKNIPNGSFVSQEDLALRPSSIDLNTFMVIDIKHSNTLPPSYQLLDGALKCREITYKIKLLNK